MAAMTSAAAMNSLYAARRRRNAIMMTLAVGATLARAWAGWW